ncbi:MAG: dCTP deaminase [Thermoprotei archaeon]|nr:dCTP deaminase [TACK group archaeon]
MMLSDFDLKNLIASGRLVVEPFSEEVVRENGLDLRLSDEVARHQGREEPLDPSKEEDVLRSYTVSKSETYVVQPGEQVLLSTLERLEMPDDLMGLVELRSTWARHGLSIPPTIVDAGFRGTITLEVVNNAPYGLLLKRGQRFAHVVFARTLSRVERPYGGFYSGQRGVTLPKKIRTPP